MHVSNYAELKVSQFQISEIAKFIFEHMRALILGENLYSSRLTEEWQTG